MTALVVEELAEGWLGFVGQVLPGLGARIDTRSVAVKLEDGSVLLWSPLDFGDQEAERIEALGEVRRLVSPNLYHHLFFGHAQQRWPRAVAWGPEGLEAKRPDLTLDRLLGRKAGFGEADAQVEGYAGAAEDEWPPEFVALPIEGMPSFREWVLLHRPSRTLLVADLVFHRPRAHNTFTRMFFRLAGTYERFAQSRLFLSFVRDKDAYRRSIEAVLDQDFDRLVMAHGDVIDAGARDRLAEALRR